MVRAGIDVAGPGDDETVLYLTRGPNVVGHWSASVAESSELFQKNFASDQRPTGA